VLPHRDARDGERPIQPFQTLDSWGGAAPRLPCVARLLFSEAEVSARLLGTSCDRLAERSRDASFTPEAVVWPSLAGAIEIRPLRSSPRL
jgi:hypothetical protein